MITLIRFTYDPEAGGTAKLQKEVAFGEELVVDKYLAGAGTA